MNTSAVRVNDVVTSRVPDGHDLFVVSGAPDAPVSVLYRGNGWSPQYALARGARLATRKGGALRYTTDNLGSVEYLESFRVHAPERH